jgi:toxin ParE1/3/4
LNKYALIISEPAISDLNEIWMFIAQDNPVNADIFINKLYDECEKLTMQPRVGRSREELLPDLRSIAYKNYIIFYRINGEYIEMVRILHGARDIDSIIPGSRLI